MQLERLEAAETDIEHLDWRINEKLVPYREPHTPADADLGIDRVGAAVLVAKLGVDMSVFPSVRHCAAWAGMCPKATTRARKGNVHLTTALVQAAVSASHAKGTYLKDKYWRLKAKRGAKRSRTRS